MRGWPGRPTWRRCPRRCSPAALATGSGLREVAEAARAAPPSPRPVRGPDLLLDGLALLATDGYPAGAPVLKRAVSVFRGEVSREAAGTCSLTARSRSPVRPARSRPHVLAGEFAEAASLVAQVEAASEATGSTGAPYAALMLAALRGQEIEAAELIEAGLKEAERRREGEWLTFAQWATAVLYNSLGRYEQALAAAEQASSPARSPSSRTPDAGQRCRRRRSSG
jgi:hypothetical protein